MRERLWVPLSIILLIPVPVVLLSHRAITGSGSNQELFTGLSSLDSILTEAEGKPVLINFWATWCGPCVRELPELEAVAAEFGDEAVFLAVDIGDPDLETLETFRENNPIGLTMIWLDPADAESVSLTYSLPDALPVTLVLDPGGTEKARAVGARSGDWFASAVAGASTGETMPMQHGNVHVYVVGSPDDPLVAELAEAALEIAGEEGFDVLDPTVQEDMAEMELLYLPLTGWPYAQLCVGGACRPPVSTAAELLAAFEEMR